MGIANIINVTGSAGGGEIIRELSNSSDGQGLHLNGTAGTIPFTPVNLGTKYSFEFVVKADSLSGAANANYLVAFQSGGNAIFGHNSGNLSFYSVGAWYSLGVNPLSDLKVHHIVLTIDGTTATVFDNGNQTGTVTIAMSDIDSCSTAAIGSNAAGSAGFFNGSLYRARFYNKALTQAEVDNAYQRADVDFADQYGSQTSLVDANASTFVGTSTYGWVKYGNNTIANTSNQLVVTYVDNSQGAYNYLKDSTDLTTNLTVGKKYKVQIDAKYAGGSAGAYLQVYDGANYIDASVLTTSLTTYYIEFTAQHATNVLVKVRDLSESNVITLDNFYVYRCGAVTDYDLAFANPTQSLMVQDRAGAADGTASATGVLQTQKIVQLNSTSARIGTTAATPADGDLIVGSDIGVGIAPSTRVHISDNGTASYSTSAAPTAQVKIDTSGNTNSAYTSMMLGTRGSSGTGRGVYLTAVPDGDGDNALAVSTADNYNTAERFRISASGDVSINAAGADQKRNLNIHGTNGASELYTLNIEADGANAMANFKIGQGGGAATTKMSISSTGNVHIGSGTLASIGDGPTLGLVGDAPEITLRDSASGTPYSIVRTNDSGDLVLEADRGDNAANSKIDFWVDGASRATITGSGGTASIRGENSITLANDATTSFEGASALIAVYDTAGQGALFYSDYAGSAVTKLGGDAHFNNSTSSGTVRIFSAANDATVTIRNYAGSNRTIKIVTLGM